MRVKNTHLCGFNVKYTLIIINYAIYSVNCPFDHNLRSQKIVKPSYRNCKLLCDSHKISCTTFFNPTVRYCINIFIFFPISKLTLDYLISFKYSFKQITRRKLVRGQQQSILKRVLNYISTFTLFQVLKVVHKLEIINKIK